MEAGIVKDGISSNSGIQLNNFDGQQEQKSSSLPIIDCEVSGWSEWSPCSCDSHNPKKERKRKIKVHPQNGGW